MASPLTETKSTLNYYSQQTPKRISNIFRKASPKALLAGLLIALGAPAHADCAGLAPLAVIHDAYRVLVEENPSMTKSIAANELLNLVPIYSAQTFRSEFFDLSLDIEVARLEKVLVDAFFLGRDALAGRLIEGNTPQFHQQNADWLTGTISRTGCFTEAGGAASPQNTTQNANQSNTAPQSSSSIDLALPTLSKSAKVGASLSVLTILLVTMAGFLIYQSRHFRIKRVARLPRHTVAFTASASFADTTHSIIVLDLSQGGAKIECDHPPLAAEELTLHLPCGSVPATIVWATAFYAGVMFESLLSEDDLQAILNDDGVTTRSRLSNVF